MNRESHPLYSTWKSMKTRCLNPNSSSYKYYGGRGINICEEWILDFNSFVRDMGERPEGCTLDRIDVDGGYNKENCRWATREEQASNKTNNTSLFVNGEWLTESQVARKYGISRTTVQQRRRSGFVGDELVLGKIPKGVILYLGNFYKQKDFAKALGISPQLLNKRIKERGSTPEELINEFGTVQGFNERGARLVLPSFSGEAAFPSSPYDSQGN